MSWVSESSRHFQRLWTHRALRGNKLELPRPLDLAVFTCDRWHVLSEFMDALVTRTHWPLRVHLCDGGSRDANMLTALAKWDGRKAGPHVVAVHRRESCGYPEGFNDGLKQVSAGIFAIGDADVIVPDLGANCWATELLGLMRRFPHVGWLAVKLDEKPVSADGMQGDANIGRKTPGTVMGTRGLVERVSCETRLAIMRRDLFLTAGDAPRIERLYREQVNPDYAVGQARDVIAEFRGWNTEYVPDGDGRPRAEARGAKFIPHDRAPANIPFHIVTRTHGRPEFFRRCRESIERQTAYRHVVHVVTYETPGDLDYIPSGCVKVKVEPQPGVGWHYNAYMTPALAACRDGGLVMFLDDDDYLVNGWFIESVLRTCSGYDAIFFRVRVTGKKVVPRKLPFAVPVYGDIASCGAVMRTEIAKRREWEAGRAQDYSYLNHMFRFHLLNKARIAWSREVPVSTQQGANWGKAADARGMLEFEDGEMNIIGAE